MDFFDILLRKMLQGFSQKLETTKIKMCDNKIPLEWDSSCYFILYNNNKKLVRYFAENIAGKYFILNPK